MSQFFGLPKKGGAFGSTTLDDGRTVQYYRYGPNQLRNAEKVKFLEQKGKLNELLGLGPVSKDEAIARASAGEPGAVVTERTPDGTPVKNAVGTTATVPDQAAALEASKTPGNTVQVETPEQSLGDRVARVQGEVAQAPPTVQPKVVEPNPAGKPAVRTAETNPELAALKEKMNAQLGERRVLESQDEANIKARDAAAAEDAQRAQTVAQQLKDKETARQAAAAEEAGVKAEAKRNHAAKADQEKTAQANAAAEKIVAKYPQVGSYADADAVRARAKAMAREAGMEGIDVPKKFPEGHPWNAAMLKLREAKDLLAPIKKELGETREEKLGRFIDREHLIDSGRMNEALAARRAEGQQGLGSPEGATEVGVRGEKAGARADADEVADQTGEHIAPSEANEGDVIASAETRHEEGATELPQEYVTKAAGARITKKIPDAAAAAREERERNIAARRAESEALRKPAAPAPRAAAGFQVAKVKNRSH